MSFGSKKTVLNAILSATTLASALAVAQAYPERAVRLVVPTAPGGANDIIARAMGPKLAEVCHQPFVVDNRAGAGGTIGAALVAKAKPDGYTLAVASISHIAIAPDIFPQKPYDGERSFAPVVQIVNQPVVLAVHPSFPARTVKELIAVARSKRGELVYGSPGIGGIMHLAGEMLEQKTGIQLVHVPYKGGGPTVIDLIGGQVPMVFVGLAPALPHIRSGRIRAIAVAGGERASVLPEVPTIGETLPNFQVNMWVGVLAPAGTPQGIVAQLNREIVKAARAPEMTQRLRDASFDVVAGTPGQFATAIRDDIRRWTPVLRVAGIKPE